MFEIGDTVICFSGLGKIQSKEWNEELKETVYTVKWKSVTLKNVTKREMVPVEKDND